METNSPEDMRAKKWIMNESKKGKIGNEKPGINWKYGNRGGRNSCSKMIMEEDISRPNKYG